MPALSLEQLRGRVLEALRQAAPSKQSRSSYVLALSGGGDSVALLRLLAGQVTLRCIHVNHGLGPQADEMQGAATFMAARCGVQIHCVSLHDPPESNIEEWAREQRYAVLKQQMQAGESILTAHHQDDQAETFLLAASRASGPAGLRGMQTAQPFGVGWLVRPALGLRRKDLQSVLHPAHDVWVEDRANADPRFDRSRLRVEIMPALEKWRPSAPPNLARSAALQQQIYEEQSAILGVLSECLQADDPASWKEPLWLQLPATAQDRLLRRWAAEAGAPRMPSSLAPELVRQAQGSARHRTPVVSWQGWSWRIHDRRIYLVPPLPKAQADASDAYPVNTLPWLNGSVVSFSGPRQMSGQLVTAKGRFRLAGSGSSAPRLQQVFRDCDIPPWIRALWPVWLREDGRALAAEISKQKGHEAPEIRWLQPPAWASYWVEKAQKWPFR